MFILKYESNTFKSNFILLLSYLINKHSNDLADSTHKLKLYANLIECDVMEMNYDFKMKIKQIRRNNFYIQRYQEYYEHLIIVCSDLIKNPKKLNSLISDLSKLTRFDTKTTDLIFTKQVNMKFKKILVSATMSAGKSTLVNALIGTKVMATKNESCTAKRFYIYEQRETKEHLTCIVEGLKFRVNSNSIQGLNDLTAKDINLYTNMYHLKDQELWQIIDSPGVNSSADPVHKEMTYSLVRDGNFDILLYVMNGSQLGTTDDIAYLRFIKEHVHSSKIIFIINKVDQFRTAEDSIADSCKNAINQLLGLGFIKPKVYPLSTYSAFLFKQVLSGFPLSEEQEDDLHLLKRKFNRETYDLTGIQPPSTKWIKKSTLKRNVAISKLLERCGIVALEEELIRRDV